MKLLKRLFSALLLVAAFGTAANAQTTLCDVAYQNCRTPVLNLINNERVGIDVSFWFMTDSRYSSAIVNAWNRGVRIRVLMDPRASKKKAGNQTILNQLQAAGIPMIWKPFGDIIHMKTMIFAGQGVVEFSGANYSPYEYLTQVPYSNYHDEVIYFSNEPDVVQSMMRRYDDVWVDARYIFYANAIPRRRAYPLYSIDSDFSFPPEQDYIARLLTHINAETYRINVVMYRIIDWRPATALIQAVQRGVEVFLIHEPQEYRDTKWYTDSWNIDRMYMAGVHIRMRAHTGQTHQKTAIFQGQHLVAFGSSNWAPSGSLEANYFTTKNWFYNFFLRQFVYKWNSRTVSGQSLPQQTVPFVPLPPDKPKLQSPAYGATGVATATTLKWHGGFWAWKYDLYFGTSPNPPLYRANLNLDPSVTPTDFKQWNVSLAPHTTYYWRVVGKTMANRTASGPVWKFTTGG